MPDWGQTIVPQNTPGDEGRRWRENDAALLKIGARIGDLPAQTLTSGRTFIGTPYFGTYDDTAPILHIEGNLDGVSGPTGFILVSLPSPSTLLTCQITYNQSPGDDYKVWVRTDSTSSDTLVLQTRTLANPGAFVAGKTYDICVDIGYQE